MQSSAHFPAASPVRMRGAWVDILCLLLLYAWIAAYSYPFFFDALIGNVREIQSYNLDTMMMLNGVNAALESPGFQLRFNDYGHFYFNLAIAASALYSMFAPVTETVLMTILRLVSLLGGCASIAMVFVFARRYLGRTEALFSAAALAFSPALIEYSNEVKPDTWQIFFIVLSLYYLARAGEVVPAAGGPARRRLPAFELRFVLAAAAAAGVAFGTKYLGMFLIPLVGVAAMLVPTAPLSRRLADFIEQKRQVLVAGCLLAILLILIGRWTLDVLGYMQLHMQIERGSKVHLLIRLVRMTCFAGAILCLAVALAHARAPGIAALKRIFATRALARTLILLGSGAAFVAAFAISSPWLVWHLSFVSELYLRSANVAEGQHFGFTWLQKLFGLAPFEEMYVAHAVGVFCVAGVALLPVALARRGWRGATLPVALVLGFALIFLALLVTKINRATVIYGLPLIPCLVLLAAYALHELRDLLARKVGKNQAAAAVALLAVLLVAAQAWQGMGILKKYDHLVVALTPANQQLGEWYTRCAPPQARILSASYTYVPPMFKSLLIGESYSYFVRAAPDIVTINLLLESDTARDEAAAARLPGHLPSDQARFYSEIARPGTWVAGPQFGQNRVYVKAGYALNPACR